eukprot:m.11442 g.11442  ORF g.11442 m.11442 type:complete len:389 (+) comp6535_c0_seq1:176-1342(+)
MRVNCSALAAVLLALLVCKTECSSAFCFGTFQGDVTSPADFGGASPCVVDGSVTLVNQAISDLSFLAPVQNITGSLTLANVSGLFNVSLPSLEHVGPMLSINANPDLRVISLPALVSTTSQLYTVVSSNPQLLHISMPSVAVTGPLLVTLNPALLDINFQALKQVDTLQVNQNQALTSISLPLLRLIMASDLQITSNAVLSSILLPSLYFCENNLTVENNPSLQAINIQGLIGVNGYFSLVNNPALNMLNASRLLYVWDDLTISGNNALPQLVFPVLTNYSFTDGTLVSGCRSLTIANNAQLSVISFQQLRNISGSLIFENNYALQTIDMPMFKQLDGNFSICANPSMASLPPQMYALHGWQSCTVCLSCNFCPRPLECPSSSLRGLL